MEGKLVHHSPSIADVAREAGVSKATVSHWLNGHSAKLSAQTRDKLNAVADRLGYRPMLGARRLSSRTRSGTVALLVRRDLAGVFADPFFARVMEGVGRSFDAGGVRGLVVTSPAAPGEDTDYLLSLARGIVDGFLVFDIEDHDKTLDAFVRHSIPFVAVGQPETDAEFPWVATDHGAAVAEAVAWLADQGHRRIGLETGSPSLLVNRHRLRGFRSALQVCGLPLDAVNPTAVLRTRAIHGELPPPPGAEVVLLDAFPGTAPAFGAWIEAPSSQVGERAAQMLDQRIRGSFPPPELHPARFHRAAQAP